MTKTLFEAEKKQASARKHDKKIVGKNDTHIVSPEARDAVDDLLTPKKKGNKKGPARVLFGEDANSKVDAQSLDELSVSISANKKRKAHVVTPSTAPTSTSDDDTESPSKVAPSAKRRLLFGRYVSLVQCAPNVDSVYKIVRKLTGNIGGNGYSGPIYGELTKHSMQKMIDRMVSETGFSSSSRFIDVGSGIGKPNLHVAQYPGVEFSCGVEMEHNRWALGMTCLNACLNAAVEERKCMTENSENKDSLLQGNTMFLHNNILEAKTFDPFTHVYMFSIGFPPELWINLSRMWNRSDVGSCRYLVCYAPPKDIIDKYEFNVELLSQMNTSMHGSKENHMGYIYRRTITTKGFKVKATSSNTNVVCDPLFKPTFDLVKCGLTELEKEVNRQVNDEMGSSVRMTRSRQKTVFSKH